MSLTTGDQGVLLATRHERVSAPARIDAVADTIGAGDEFVAALIHWLLGRLGHEPARQLPEDPPPADELLTFAMRCAGITLGRPGADLPCREEVGAVDEQSSANERFYLRLLRTIRPAGRGVLGRNAQVCRRWSLSPRT